MLKRLLLLQLLLGDGSLIRAIAICSTVLGSLFLLLAGVGDEMQNALVLFLILAVYAAVSG
jgi:hypothetical protein